MDDEPKRAKAGRKKQEVTRPQWRVRLPNSLSNEIAEAAKSEGRSISEELEYRIIKGTEYKEKWRDMQFVIGESSIDYANAVIQKNIEVALLQYGYTAFQVLGEFLWVRSGANVEEISRRIHLANSISMPDQNFIKELGAEIARKLADAQKGRAMPTDTEANDDEG